jgi:hypothetical protein
MSLSCLSTQAAQALTANQAKMNDSNTESALSRCSQALENQLVMRPLSCGCNQRCRWSFKGALFRGSASNRQLTATVILLSIPRIQHRSLRLVLHEVTKRTVTDSFTGPANRTDIAVVPTHSSIRPLNGWHRRSVAKPTLHRYKPRYSIL